MMCFKIERHWMSRKMCVMIREKVKDWAKYEADLLYQKVYNKCGNNQRPMPLKYSYVLESRNYAFPVTPHRPSHMLIMDDCQGTNMYGIGRTDVMNHVTIKHRRTSHLMGDKKQLKQIYENFSNTIQEGEFIELYKYATSKPHGFYTYTLTLKKRVKDLGVVFMSTFILENKSD